MIIRCKMCGGTLEIREGVSVAVCEYCGTQQTLPNADNEKKLALLSRADRLRFGCDFDKAAGVFETVVSEFPEEAEAYWGLVLCKYGIEYVDDPATGKKVPTCHRSGYESVLDDVNFELALEYADSEARPVYRSEAKEIERLRKGILEVSGKERPYDVFICYKETDARGERTLDSVLAQDIYDALTEKGYRTFFARITLEDKLGQEYEPYIFAALHSAKVMLAIGTDYEHFNAVWVKNEWSRFLKLMEKDKSKALIPCYKGIDAYDMPKEFARLQAQDLGKVGAVQDLLRGVEKLVAVRSSVSDEGVGSAAAQLLKRAHTLVESGDWNKADTCCEQLLNLEPENAEAYLLKLMIERRVTQQEALAGCAKLLEGSENYKQALKYGDTAMTNRLQDWNEAVRRRLDTEARKRAQMQKKLQKKLAAVAAAAVICVAGIFVYKSVIAPGMAYKTAEKLLAAEDYGGALREFRALDDFRDAEDRCIEVRNACMQAYESRLAAGDYAGAIDALEQIGDYSRKGAVYHAWGEALMEQADYAGAVKAFKYAGSTEEVKEQLKVAGEQLLAQEDYAGAINAFDMAGVGNGQTIYKEACYGWGKTLMEQGEYEKALEVLEKISGYFDSASLAEESARYIMRAALANINVGDTFTLGKYSFETRSLYRDKRPEITWRVLAREGDRILAISENILDVSIHREIDSVLNVMYHSALSNHERLLVDDGGFFILTKDEVEKYFINEADRKVYGTDKREWWLKTDAGNGNYAVVLEDGSINERLSGTSKGLRPAMWLDIS